MDFNSLVADFAARHNVNGLAAEDNEATLDIDGIVVTLVAANDVLSLSAEIGEPPAEGRADFADMLLEANLQADFFFAKTLETGAYIVIRRLALASLDNEAFDDALEALVNQAETWRRLLEDFRPVAAEAAKAEETSAAFPNAGFMSV